MKNPIRDDVIAYPKLSSPQREIFSASKRLQKNFHPVGTSKSDKFNSFATLQKKKINK